jgi:hypothetical protein
VLCERAAHDLTDALNGHRTGAPGALRRNGPQGHDPAIGPLNASKSHVASIQIVKQA